MLTSAGSRSSPPSASCAAASPGPPKAPREPQYDLDRRDALAAGHGGRPSGPPASGGSETGWKACRKRGARLRGLDQVLEHLEVLMHAKEVAGPSTTGQRGEA